MKFIAVFSLFILCACDVFAGRDAINKEFKPKLSASIAEENQRIDFPNYFASIHKDKALSLINQSLRSILQRLQVPYVDRDGNFRNDGFFAAINKLAQEKSPGARVYIAGGMVRSVLGYVYKKLYNADMRARATRSDGRLSADETLSIVLQTFDRIVNGNSRKPSAISTKIVSHMPFQGNTEASEIIQEEEAAKEVSHLNALGIASDYDILIDFPINFKGDKKIIINEITDLINSAEKKI